MQYIRYNSDFEILIKRESEIAECYSILHRNSSLMYSTISNIINIPIIALSSIVGFLSVVPIFPQQTIVLGSISIGIGVLKAIDSFFGFSKKAETHRMTSLNYAKISKYIQIQLSLERNQRISAIDLYQLIIHDLQAIKESEPDIPDIIIKKFKKKYGHDTETARPAITNGLTNVVINNSIDKYLIL